MQRVLRPSVRASATHLRAFTSFRGYRRLVDERPETRRGGPGGPPRTRVGVGSRSRFGLPAAPARAGALARGGTVAGDPPRPRGPGEWERVTGLGQRGG